MLAEVRHILITQNLRTPFNWPMSIHSTTSFAQSNGDKELVGVIFILFIVQLGFGQCQLLLVSLSNSHADISIPALLLDSVVADTNHPRSSSVN
jgi:hypothetical protein